MSRCRSRHSSRGVVGSKKGQLGLDCIAHEVGLGNDIRPPGWSKESFASIVDFRCVSYGQVPTAEASFFPELASWGSAERGSSDLSMVYKVASKEPQTRQTLIRKRKCLIRGRSMLENPGTEATRLDGCLASVSCLIVSSQPGGQTQLLEAKSNQVMVGHGYWQWYPLELLQPLSIEVTGRLA
ncbi:uncharacterized protein BDZ99DRAFT_284693 [Mytilinidion resinicola]|uniref:Uncharacterized protein n=1 Tax=Mytilinidion resinicola TaxID=574789 RepID=A0A6A6YVN9_9PEZI|nr:uncharacterized protein BDZ99DRAFT_284693 [Mytilinidion resinicola]KAF2811977.1 hypothetical protein BDZ99DRAFT_284693 [Mytilinidion resinicola]